MRLFIKTKEKKKKEKEVEEEEEKEEEEEEDTNPLVRILVTRYFPQCPSVLTHRHLAAQCLVGTQVS